MSSRACRKVFLLCLYKKQACIKTYDASFDWSMRSARFRLIILPAGLPTLDIDADLNNLLEKLILLKTTLGIDLNQ